MLSPLAVNLTSLTFAAERRRACTRRLQLSIDILPTGRSTANPPAAVAAVDRWDRQTDGRTPDRYIDVAGSVSNKHSLFLYLLLSSSLVAIASH